MAGVGEWDEQRLGWRMPDGEFVSIELAEAERWRLTERGHRALHGDDPTRQARLRASKRKWAKYQRGGA